MCLLSIGIEYMYRRIPKSIAHMYTGRDKYLLHRVLEDTLFLSSKTQGIIVNIEVHLVNIIKK